MTETLTIRLAAAQRKALRARAAARGKTESELVRDLIAGQLQEKSPLSERAGRHLGRLDFDSVGLDSDRWRAQLRKVNTRTMTS